MTHVSLGHHLFAVQATHLVVSEPEEVEESSAHSREVEAGVLVVELVWCLPEDTVLRRVCSAL